MVEYAFILILLSTAAVLTLSSVGDSVLELVAGAASDIAEYVD